jgi:hypothetical protein
LSIAIDVRLDKQIHVKRSGQMPRYQARHDGEKNTRYVVTKLPAS